MKEIPYPEVEDFSDIESAETEVAENPAHRKQYSRTSEFTLSTMSDSKVSLVGSKHTASQRSKPAHEISSPP